MAKANGAAGRIVPPGNARGRFPPAGMAPDLAISITHKGRNKGKPQIRTRRCTGWTEVKRDAFLEALAESANLKRALAEVEMSPSGLAKLRKREPDFDLRLQAALEEGFARLELAMLERSRFGVAQPIYHGGAKVGERIVYPDGMAMNLLRLHKDIVASVRARRIDPAVADADRDAVFVALRARIELARARRKGGPE